MSIVAPSPRLGWRLLPGVVAAALAVVVAALLMAALREHPPAAALQREAQTPPAVPRVVAAPWRVAGFSVGAGLELSKKDKARFETQKPRARRVARAIAHSLTLGSPATVDKIDGFLTAAVARSIRRSAPGVPKNATDVTAVDRWGQIGLQAPRFNTAVANLRVKARAVVKERTVRWEDRVTLWLTRDNNAWKAIAFEIDRNPR